MDCWCPDADQFQAWNRWEIDIVVFCYDEISVSYCPVTGCVG
jgi:hypothetical protein